MSFKVTAAIRKTIEQLAAELTIATGKKHTMTDVIEEAINDFSARVDIKLRLSRRGKKK